MLQPALPTTRTPDHRTRLLRFGASATLAAAVAGAALAQGAPEILPLFEPFERSFDQRVFLAGGEAMAVDIDAIKAMPADRASVIAGFPIGRDASVDLVVERIAPRTADARLEIVTPSRRKGAAPLVEAIEWPDAHLFGGTVVGDDSSRVFISLTEAGVFGFIYSEAGRFILSSGPYGSGQAPAVFSIDGDAFAAVDWLDFGCSALPRPDAGANGEGASDGGTADMIMPSCRSIDTAIETDQEYLSKFSGNVAAAVGYAQTLVAAADEIYRRDAGVQIRLTYTRIWTTQDPWNTGNSSTALPEFREYWNSYQAGVSRDVAHMLSGRALGGGIAWLDAVCSDYAYGVNGNLSGFFPTPMVTNSPQNWDVMVFNHELGHNAGSIHTHDRSPPADNCGNGNCSGAANGTIMSYCHQCSGGMNNIALVFHPLSAGEIVEYMSGASCAAVVECSSNPACVLDIGASGGSFGLAGGTASISVTTIGPLCDWTPVAAPSWITVTNPGPASGTGTFAFTVQPNAGPSRAALLAFGDLTYTVTQTGFTDCDGDGVNDEAEIAADPALDCDFDGVLNACEIAAGASDCDANGVPDACQDVTAALAWGAGEPGETGGNNNGQSTPPSGLTGQLQIAAGYGHSLARRLDGTVVAWGRNFEGQTTIPAGIGPCLKVAAGAFHSLAIRQIGTVAAWGRNFDGQCDVPSTLGVAVDIAGGNAHSVALKSDGTVVCWGQNNLGQCSVPAGLAGVTDVEAGYLHTLALRADGTVAAWGDNGFGQIAVPAGLANVTSVASAGYHSLALRANGTVVAWGRNSEGQCNVPADLGAARAVGTGMLHSIAIRTDGTVRAWGRNSEGQCNVPAAAASVQQVAGGAHHTLAFASAPGLSDCDGDGTADACAIAAGAADTNANGVPDACEGVIGDLDGTGTVNAADLAILLANWGGGGAANGDIDQSGVIDGADLAALLVNWSVN
jgi:hypothetical protein